MWSRAVRSRRSVATGAWSANRCRDASLDVQVERVHFVTAPDHLIADGQVAADEGLQRLFQQ
jgi:hypothetical protein